jgi:beta-barrel assembly-enhancing protease
MNGVRTCLRFFAVALMLSPPTVMAQTEMGPFLALQQLDQRLLSIGYRLATASAALCEDRVPLPGFTLHDLSQYAARDRSDAQEAFGFDGAPLVLALSPDSPAARAGVRVGDALMRIDDVSISAIPPGKAGEYGRTARLLTVLDEASGDGVISLVLRRDGREIEARVDVVSGCRSRFQVKVSDTINARADGAYVEVTSGAMQFAESDAELAGVIAHEMAHNILRHREMLDAQGVRRGLLGQLGASARKIRRTEEEADRLSVYLMEAAGFSPEAIVSLWERHARSHGGAVLQTTHAGWRARVAVVQGEITQLAGMRRAGVIPRPLFMTDLQNDAAPQK